MTKSEEKDISNSKYFRKLAAVMEIKQTGLLSNQEAGSFICHMNTWCQMALIENIFRFDYKRKDYKNMNSILYNLVLRLIMHTEVFDNLNFLKLSTYMVKQ